MGQALKTGAMDTKKPRKLILSTVYRALSWVTLFFGSLLLVVSVINSRLGAAEVPLILTLFLLAIVLSGIAQVLDLILEIAESTKLTASNSVIVAKSSYETAKQLTTQQNATDETDSSPTPTAILG